MTEPSKIRVSVGGKPVEVPYHLIDGHGIIIKGRFLRIALGYDDFLSSTGIESPDLIVQALGGKADIFTFLGSFTETVNGGKAPTWQHACHQEYDHVAAIHVVSFEHWWKDAIDKSARRNVKKAGERGVSVRRAALDDRLIEGVVRIFNETPVRQGKAFWHYGKGFDQVKEEISTYADRSIFLGAYFEDELIGFAKLINCGAFGRANQLLSMLKHRDKPVTNSMIAELVMACEREKIPYLVYGAWSEGSLGEFKRHNGFKKVSIPRYYVPMTLRGRVALRTGLHRGAREMLPNFIRGYLREIRKVWYHQR